MSPFKRKRLAAGLTQDALAKKLKVNPSTVSSWESGRQKPQPEFFPKLAVALDATPEEVTYLFDTPDPSVPSVA